MLYFIYQLGNYKPGKREHTMKTITIENIDFTIEELVDLIIKEKAADELILHLEGLPEFENHVEKEADSKVEEQMEELDCLVREELEKEIDYHECKTNNTTAIDCFKEAIKIVESVGPQYNRQTRQNFI
jgi:hypothetical protein